MWIKAKVRIQGQEISGRLWFSATLLTNIQMNFDSGNKKASSLLIKGKSFLNDYDSNLNM